MDMDIEELYSISAGTIVSEDTISALIYNIKSSSHKKKFTALRELSKLIKSNKIPENRLRETFDLFLSLSSHRSDMVGGLSRHWAVQLLEKVLVSQTEINHIINLLLSHFNDLADQGGGSIKLIVKLIEIGLIPENRKEQIFERLKQKSSSSNKKVSNKAIEGIKLLEEMNQTPRSDSVSEISHSTTNSLEEASIVIRTTNTGLSDLDSLASQINQVKGKKEIKQLWKQIEKYIKDRSISDKKAEEFLFFLETKAMGNPGRTAKKSLKVIKTLIEKYDISLKSAEHLLKLILKQFSKENVSQQKLIKLINILAKKNLIAEALKDEILNLLRSNLSKASLKMAKSITEGIKLITQSQFNRIDTEVESVNIEHLINVQNDIEEIDIDVNTLNDDVSKESHQELELTKISYTDTNKLKLYVDQLNFESTDMQVKIEALSAIKKLISKNRILETDIDFIIQLLINKSAHKDQEVKYEAILAIVAVINKYSITSNYLLTNILSLLIAATNNNPPICTAALQGITNFIMKDYLPEEKIDEVFSLLMIKANQKYIWAKAAAIRGITRLIEKEKLHHEHILKVKDLLIYNVKHGPEEVDTIALKGISILADKNKFIEESIEEILILLIKKAKNSSRSTKNNALDAITIITKKYNLTQKVIPELLELVWNIAPQIDPKAEQLVETLKENSRILEFLVSLFENNDTEYKKCAVQVIARLNYNVDQFIFNLESIIGRKHLKNKILNDLNLLKVMLADRIDLIEALNSKIDTLESIKLSIKSKDSTEASTIQHIEFTGTSDISPNQGSEAILSNPSLKAIKPFKLKSEEIDKHVLQPRSIHRNKITEDILDNVMQESLKQAEESHIIGPRILEGFHLKDVNDKGNCFYEAVIDQMQLLSYEFIDSIPDGTAPHDSLRLTIQGNEFKDEEWADDKIIDKFVLTFRKLVLAVVDTKNPQLGFVYYYSDQNGEIITNIGDNILPERVIIRIAYTGNHFLSVISYPALLNIAINDEFHPTQDIVKTIDQSPMHNEEITSLTSSINTINLLRDNSEEIAKSVLARSKLLLKANSLSSSNPDIEQEFISELAMCLRVVYKNLLELFERNQDLKLNFIKKLASELKKERKIYIKDEKFVINEEIQEDSEVFFSSAIINVKEQLKQHIYLDELSNIATKLEIRYITKFEYYAENLLLSRDELIYEAGQIGGIEAINNFIELGKDKDIAVQILLAAEEFGAKHVLEVLFGDKTQSSELEAIEITEQELFALIQDEQLLETIAKIEKIIGKETLVELSGWHQYVMKALSHNPISKHATQVIHVIGNLVNNLEEWLDFGNICESINVEDQVVIILSQLEHMFDFVASGIPYVGLPPRYPDFDPDYGFSGGSGGSDDNIHNNHQSDINNIDFSSLFVGLNSSIYI